ncbi:MAG: efflux RND transporter periplasmic adaptor subunit [Candidatus Cloacimonetes bacterium]|nr:efflux RND transporter periplasmic adaptor subunit [Candidatus Cloacimonadota bacterium]
MKKFIIIFLIIGGLVGGYFIYHKSENVEETVQFPRTTVTRGTISIRMEETGEIQPQSIVSIQSRVTGRVVHLYVDENDFVRAGQLIADIEPDYNQARTMANIRNELRLAEIRLQDATINLEEGTTLFENNFISRIEYQRLQDNLETAKLDLDIARQQFALIEDIETRENISRVYATTTGTIIERNIEEGEMVTASTTSFGDGTILMRVADLTNMVVNSTINEVDISKISERMTATIRIDAFPYDTFTGSISRISAQARIESNVRVFPIQIEIDQRDNRLRPGLSANVTILGETREDILVIPIRAIFSDVSGSDIVYKVENDTIGPPVFIRTGINDMQRVEILEGLLEDEEISLQEPRRS